MQLKQEGTRVIAASSGTTSRLESSIAKGIHLSLFPIGQKSHENKLFEKSVFLLPPNN